MKKIIACIFAVIWIQAVFPAFAAEEIPTAEQLYADNPEPEVTFLVDPMIDPALRLVNKKNGLAWDYVPELVTPDIANKPGIAVQLCAPEAREALEALFSAALEDGYTLSAVSGYRSYSAQKLIYNRKVEERGEASASLSSAPPGKSEHQLGLAMDVSCASIDYRLNKIFADTDEGKWLYAHCAEYGFIIRYKTEWTKITGYKGEPWHIRYVGVEHAKLIEKLNVPFEVYIEYLELCWQGMNQDIPE